MRKDVMKDTYRKVVLERYSGETHSIPKLSDQNKKSVSRAVFEHNGSVR